MNTAESISFSDSDVHRTTRTGLLEDSGIIQWYSAGLATMKIYSFLPGSRCELLTFILAPTIPASLRLRRFVQ